MFDLAKFTAEARANKEAARNRPEVYQLPNGKWKHRLSQIEWSERDGAATDLRFCKEWGLK